MKRFTGPAGALVTALASALVCAPATAQTMLDVRSQTRNFDLSGASSTRPFPVGASMPPICNIGETYFRTDVTPGRNLYLCIATNMWMPIEGGTAQQPQAGPTGGLIVTESTDGSWLIDIDTAFAATQGGNNTWSGTNDFSQAASLQVVVSSSKPAAAGCDSADKAGRVALRVSDPAHEGNVLYLCQNTGSGTYGWRASTYAYGIERPQSCEAGEMFFDIDAPAADRWLGCVSTNTWASLGGGAGGSAGLGDPGSNGLVARDAANTTVARTVRGGAGIVVQNGDGVAGDPTVSVDPSVITGVANTFSAGARQTFGHNSASAGIRVLPAAGDPTAPQDGDIWLNSTTGKLRVRQAGATTDVVAPAGLGDPGSNGLLARSSTNSTVARMLQAGAGVVIQNGDGIAGNPQISVSSSVVTSTAANTFGAGARQTFIHNSTAAGLRVQPAIGDPASPQDGDIWFNSTTGKLRTRQGGTNMDLVSAAAAGLGDSGSNGMVIRTAPNTTTSRSLQAGAGVAIQNGDGILGNPVVSVDSSVVTSTAANTFGAGARQTFTHNSTAAGLRVQPAIGDPASPQDGDIWFNSTTGKLRTRQGGTNMDLISAGSGGSAGLGDSGSNGMVIRTAPNTTVSRILQAGTGVVIQNGDGIAGNPVVSVDSSVVTSTAANTFDAGARQTFRHGANAAGLRIQPGAGDPALAQDGDMWVNATTGRLRVRQNGAATDVVSVLDDSTMEVVEHFIGGANTSGSIGALGWRTLANSGSVSVNLAASDIDHIGVVEMVTGTAANNDAGLIPALSTTALIPDVTTFGNWEMRFKFRLTSITDREVRIGMAAGGTSASHHVAVQYSSASGPNWKLQTCKGGGCLNADLGVPADTGWHRVRIWSTTPGTVYACMDACTNVQSFTGAPLPILSMIPSFYVKNMSTDSTAASIQCDEWRLYRTGVQSW